MAAGPPPILPPAPVVDPSDPGYPSADNAARNQAAQLQRFADKMNADSVRSYQGLMEGVQVSVNAGRDPGPIPHPPLKFVVKDGGIVISDELACPVIVPKQPEMLASGLDGGGIVGTPANTTDIGAVRGGIGYNCGPHDTNPVGTVISLPDGTKVKKVNWGPFGFYYEFTR